MSLRTKTLTVVAIFTAASFAALGALVVGRIVPSFARLEERDARRNLERGREAVATQVEALCEKATDWAWWDDAYGFMDDRNAGFVASNLVEISFVANQLNAILFFSPDGKLAFGRAWDAQDGLDAPLPEVILSTRLAPGSPLVSGPAPGKHSRGVLIGPGHPPFLFCAEPILRSDATGPARGTLLFGSWLTGARQEAIRRLTRLEMTFSASTTAEGDLAGAWEVLGQGAEDHLVEVSDTQLAGFTAVRDPDGKGALLLRAALPREVRAEAHRTVTAVLVAFALAGLAFAAATLLILERLVLRRIAAMSRTLTDITRRFEFEGRVEAQSADEVGRLGHAVNGLLAAMEQAMSTARHLDERSDQRSGERGP